MRRLAALLAVLSLACGGAHRSVPGTSVAAAKPVPSSPSSPQGPVVPPAEQRAERPRFVVHVVDVGTGLGVLVAGEDFTLVYDAGSNDDTAIGAKNRFLAYLRATKPSLQRIDHIILSHPHRDHVELLPDLFTSYAVANVWDAGAINPICGYRRFIGAIAAAPQTTYHSGTLDAGRHTLDFARPVCKLPASAEVQHGPRIEEGVPIALGHGAKMTFLHVDGTRRTKDFNETSLVTLLELDGARVLFMGDAEAGGRALPKVPPTPRSIEGYLLRQRRELIDADVLIVGHHGSQSSSRRAFLDAVTPKVSVLSSGPMRYDDVTLPDAAIVSELAQVSALFRTDVDDAACAKNPKKIGPDSDGQPGGCDNVQIEIQAGKLKAGYARLAD